MHIKNNEIQPDDDDAFVVEFIFNKFFFSLEKSDRVKYLYLNLTQLPSQIIARTVTRYGKRKLFYCTDHSFGRFRCGDRELLVK